MMEGQRKRHSLEASSSLVTRYNERFSALGELLARIPNDITVNQISTKLSWSDLRALSWVSRAWRQAIHCRLIYDTRVQSHKTETLVILNHSHSLKTNGIALYSLREKQYFHLPPIPNVKSGIPTMCQLIGFDGRIYIFGGKKTMSVDTLETKKVYVLDLGGQRQWKECASMQKPRAGGGCCVMYGKIYVVGSSNRTHTSEVYDPKTDAWSGIGFEKYGLQKECVEVGIVGGELFVFGDCSGMALLWAYHPVTRTWRYPRLNYDIHRSAPGCVFIMQGKFHSMSPSAICVYDFDTNRWTLHLSYSLARIAPGLVEIMAVQVVDGELLAVVCYRGQSGRTFRSSLIRIRRFNSEDKETVWQIAQCPLLGEDYPLPRVGYRRKPWKNTWVQGSLQKFEVPKVARKGPPDALAKSRAKFILSGC